MNALGMLVVWLIIFTAAPVFAQDAKLIEKEHIGSCSLTFAVCFRRLLILPTNRVIGIASLPTHIRRSKLRY